MFYMQKNVPFWIFQKYWKYKFTRKEELLNEGLNRVTMATVDNLIEDTETIAGDD